MISCRTSWALTNRSSLHEYGHEYTDEGKPWSLKVCWGHGHSSPSGKIWKIRLLQLLIKIKTSKAGSLTGSNPRCSLNPRLNVEPKPLLNVPVFVKTETTALVLSVCHWDGQQFLLLNITNCDQVNTLFFLCCTWVVWSRKVAQFAWRPKSVYSSRTWRPELGRELVWLLGSWVTESLTHICVTQKLRAHQLHQVKPCRQWVCELFQKSARWAKWTHNFSSTTMYTK